mgnify:CR=1 FL=1
MDSLANLLSNTYVKEIYMIAHMEYEEAGVFYLTGFEQLAINTAFLQRKYPSASSMEGLAKEIEKGTAKIAEMNKSTGNAKRMLMRYDTKLVKLYSSLIDHTWTALDHMPADAYKNKEYLVGLFNYDSVGTGRCEAALGNYLECGIVAHCLQFAGELCATV